MFDTLFAWPDQFVDNRLEVSSFERCCRLLRTRNFSECESILLSSLAFEPDSKEYTFLYAFLLLSTNRRSSAKSLSPLSL